ncbi:MAG: sarcosine oxidase subunit alpha family protein [Kiloniellales bacterium]|nr:sarcosine oxidase subunit alpha family protein [Kiloniellales bacterium]
MTAPGQAVAKEGLALRETEPSASAPNAQARRRSDGGLIDHSRSLSFSFDGQALAGHPGDTLASALLANGVRLLGRSFKYHRPRGVLTAGSEEPNALVELRSGARREPNTRATVVELYDGLEAASQNRWPSLRFDVSGVNDLLSPFLTAGFYYKTFMWPAAFWEKVYEPLIRRAAGLGRLSGAPDPDTYEKSYAFCDVLVIGAGPAGLMAALTAGRAGARVILADEDFRPGGRLLAETHEVGGVSGALWTDQVMDELASLDNVRCLPRTTVYGVYDGGTYGALERVADHLPVPPPGQPRQRLWKIVAKRAVLAAGAIERPIAFGNNDRPGILLAGAQRSYLNRFGVLAGSRTAVFTCNDDGWRSAADLVRIGAEVAAVIDSRPDARRPDHLNGLDGVELIAGGRVVETRGRFGLTSLDCLDRDGRRRSLTVDCLAVSGGWNPALHLTCHQGARPVWSDDLAAFVPADNLPADLAVAGAAAGSFSTQAALREGADSGGAAAEAAGHAVRKPELPAAEDGAVALTPFWHVKESKSRAWLDFQNDVTVKDVALSFREGFQSVEHLKRYTTLGMATDQGKTANVQALAIMAELTGKSIPETGTTVFRPPYTPVPIAAFAGRSQGKDFRPFRLTPSHDWAVEQGAVFVETGAWLRAQWFPQAGETHWRQSVDRETLAVRKSVGVCDVTTLGKIDIQGADAAAFLNRVYANGFAKLPVGKVRYGLMLREDGFVMDDGTTARLGETHYVMTTTTAKAVPVFRHLEFCRQVLWPELDVQLISTTEQWAQFAVAGPRSRDLLRVVVDAEHDISNEAFPYMACGEVTVCGGTRARLFRISFSGELAYEIAVPTRYGDSMIRALMAAGEAFEVVPYGTEALGVLRVEKGHPAGNELNGQTTAANLGMGRMVSKKKDCIGNVLSERPGLNAADDLRLVGFVPLDRGAQLTAGAHFIAQGAAAVAAEDQGYMTSVAYSPNLGHAIGLGLIKNGAERIGEKVRAVDLIRDADIEVEIVSPHFVDPEGERLRA